MRISVIAFTQRGAALGERIAGCLWAQGDEAELTCGFGEALHPPLGEWAETAMQQSDGLIFIGATGIAVRAIAPHLRGKQIDPAVVVVDELGRYAISLLSGHVGGANALAARIATAIGAEPVITTATDGRGVFAVDSWAKERGLTIVNPAAVKAVSAALLAGKQVGITSDFPIRGEVPSGIVEGIDAEVGIYIGVDGRKKPYPTTLHVMPPVLVLGIGCRKDIAQQVLQQQVDEALARIGATRQAVRAVHTIDIKTEEPGLVAMCGANGWPMKTYSAETLRAVEGSFAASDFVEKTVGVDNVCERAAIAEGGRLLLPKQAGNGATVAIAEMPSEVSFAEVEACRSQS